MARGAQEGAPSYHIQETTATLELAHQKCGSVLSELCSTRVATTVGSRQADQPSRAPRRGCGPGKAQCDHWDVRKRLPTSAVGFGRCNGHQQFLRASNGEM
jgi:hypothetical protein